MAKQNDICHEQSLGFRVWRGPIQIMSRPHQHNDLEINMLLHGQATYLHGGRLFDLQPEAMTLFGAAIPHRLVNRSSDAQIAWITLPLDWLWRCNCSPDLISRVLAGNMIADSQPEAQDDENFKRWHNYLNLKDSRWYHILSLEVEARFRRFLIANQSWAGPASRKPECQTDMIAFEPVQKMADFLSTHFAQPIGIQDVARHIKLHPSYAMRLFRKHMGMTMIQYLTQQRIAEARRLLITTDMPILEIVYECGFGSTSQFYHAFEAIVGQKPTAFRNRLNRKS